MNKQEFTEAFNIAQSDVDLTEVDNTHLHGCALPGFGRVVCNLRQIAKLMRHQALMMNGSWDYEELTNIQDIARRKFIIISK